MQSYAKSILNYECSPMIESILNYECSPMLNQY
jgi:hypothetical protein